MEGIIRNLIGGNSRFTSVYALVVEKENKETFTVPIETRYLSEILDDIGNIIGKKVKYENNMLYFPE